MSNLKYTKEVLEKAVKENLSFVGTMRTLGASLTSGALRTHIISRIRYYQIDTSHFLGQAWNRGLNHIGGTPKKKPIELLILRMNGLRTRPKLLKRALIESGKEYKCAKCGLSKWKGLPIRLEVEHMNGNPLDNRIGNLCFLCPNCHSQTESFCNAAVANMVKAEV